MNAVLVSLSSNTSILLYAIPSDVLLCIPMQHTYVKFVIIAFCFAFFGLISSRKCPPQLSFLCNASMHISSPNSIKSATRPALSSSGFISFMSPGILTSFQNSFFNCCISLMASCQSFCISCHATFIPHDFSQAFMKTFNCLFSFNIHQLY